MILRRMTSMTIGLAAAIALTGCGGDGGGESESSAGSTGSPATDTTTAADDVTPTATSATEPVAEIAVDVQPFEGDYEDTDTAAVREAFATFENALWESFAAGEITNEFRDLAGPDVVGGLEQSIAHQPTPLGGTVTVIATIDNVVLADSGGSPIITEAELTGCSDHTQVEYEAGNGGESGFSASIVFDDGFVVEKFTLGTEPC